MSFGAYNIDEKKWTTIPWDLCLGKLHKEQPGFSVFDHSILSYHVAKYLLKHKIKQNIKKFLPKNILFIVALHDVGKISPGFQKRICYSYYVSKTGHIPFEGELEELHPIISESSLRDILKEYAVVAGGHHGITSNDFRNSTHIKFGGKEWEDERQSFIKAVSDYVVKDGGCLFSPNKKRDKDISISMSLALTTFSDWIASNQDDFDQSDNPNALENNIKKVPSVVKSLEEKAKIKENLDFSSVFDIKNINALQSACSEIKNGEVVIIEDSMGGGKTEASLWLAYLLKTHLKNGMYYALPTKITSNAIHSRVQNFVLKITDDIGVNLVHSDSWMEPYSTDVPEVPSWYHPSKRSLLSKFGVGTIDQSLLSILNVKHNYMRLFGLAGKVVIFDEVHSYDAYTSTILFKLIHALKRIGCLVIILSATLNKKTKENILGTKISDKTGYPLITYLKSNSNNPEYIPLSSTRFRDIKISFGEMDVGKAVGLAKSGYRVLVIRNTSGKAQDTYKKIKSLSDESFCCGILHAKFTNEIRNSLEDKYIGIFGKNSTYSRGFILVATQVVEQSLDIDSDYLFTDFCPSDLLLQRLGRLWRHERSRPNGSFACVTIIMPKIDNGTYKYDMIYDHYICERSMEVLSGRKTISLPKDIREIVELTYCEREERGKLEKLKNKMDLKNKDLENMAIGGTRSFSPMHSDDERAPTRHESYPSRTMALAKDFSYDVGAGILTIVMLDGTIIKISEKEKLDFESVKKINKNMVSYPFSKKMLNRFVHIKDKFSEGICKRLPFSLDAIVKVNEDGKVYYDSHMNKPSMLGWSNEIGMYKLNDEESFNIG